MSPISCTIPAPKFHANHYGSYGSTLGRAQMRRVAPPTRWRDLCLGLRDNRKLRLTAIPRLPTIGSGGPFIVLHSGRVGPAQKTFERRRPLRRQPFAEAYPWKARSTGGEFSLKSWPRPTSTSLRRGRRAPQTEGLP